MSVGLVAVALEAVGLITIASGSTNGTASGALCTSNASIIPGTATGSGNATALGVLVSSNASFISGSAVANRNATVSGALMPAIASFLNGSASGNTPVGVTETGKLHISISISF